jgi:hypothetical protein
MSVATAKLITTRKVKLMNRMTEWQVGGYLMNGEAFKVVVSALYGYEAMKKATALVGVIKAGSAIRINEKVGN